MLRIRTLVTYPARPKPEPKAPTRKEWTLDEDQTLDDLHKTKSWPAIGAILGRSLGSVRKRAKAIGISKRGGNEA